MNTIRLIALALPLMLLMACGGGGGGGGTAATPMNMPDPMTPPTNMPGTDDPMTPPPVTLPGYAIKDLMMAQDAVGGAAPTSMTKTQIVSGIQTRATAADYFQFSDFDAMEDADKVSVTCDTSCSGTVPDVGALTFSLTDISDLSLVDDTGLMGFLDNTELVMEEGGATIIQSQAAAGQDDGTRLSFQSYGGWLDNSVFGVVSFDVTENATTTNRFASFSFGEKTGSMPASAQWRGVMVGSTEAGDIVQGDLAVTYFTSTRNFITQIGFDNIRNLNSGALIFRSGFTFDNIPLMANGTFASTNGDIKGSFYGDNHEQVGGVFNHSISNIVGAFGGVKQ